MSKLYLDHHILINEHLWPALRNIVNQGHATLVISPWNLIEIEQAENQEQKQRRVDFISSLNLIYVHEMLTLEIFEVRSFLWLYFFQAGLFPYSAFATSFSSHLKENFGILVRDDYSIIDYISNSRPENLKPIAVQQHQMTLALQTLQTIGKKKLAEIEEEAFIRYIATRLPLATPDGSPADFDMQYAMARFCYEKKQLLYKLSPAIFAEEELGRARRQDATRRPRPSDAADLMHCVVALAYCDVFITNDGFAHRCCEQAGSALARENVRTAKLFRSLQNFQNEILPDQ